MKANSPLQSLTELKQFYQVATTGSFSGAAKVLNQSTAAVSAGIKRLENDLEVRLFERSTRTVSLTDEGKQFFFHCKNIFTELDLAIDNLRLAKSELAGNLTIAAPGDLARTSLNTWIQEFKQHYPGITFDIRVSDALADLNRSAIHLALRFGIPADSKLIARPIAELPQLACATPSYIKQYGSPSHPEDLTEHHCLCFHIKQRKKDDWVFYKGEEKFTVKVSGPLTTDDSSLARQWAIEGLGIVYKSFLDVADDIKQGRLIHLLQDYHGELAPLYAVYPSKQNLPARTKAFIEFLVSKSEKLTSLA